VGRSRYTLVYKRGSEASMSELAQAIAAAKECVTADFPSVDVKRAYLHQHHEASRRWYIAVVVSYADKKQAAATVLVRVKYGTDGTLTSRRVTLLERESENERDE
jgi:hypothetical protein